jgi:putative SOS response-associated peptidase YedK
MQRNLVSAGSKEPRINHARINAEVETVASIPTYRKPLTTQRCLLPAIGHFEWVNGADQ